MAAIGLTAGLLALPAAAEEAPGPPVPEPGRYIVEYHPGVDAVDQTARLEDVEGVEADVVFSHVASGFAGEVSPEGLEVLEDDPRVASITPDGLISGDGAAGDEVAGTAAQPIAGDGLWGLDRIDQRKLPLSGRYTYATRGKGVTVYVLDSGVRATHVEFGGRVKRGVNFTDDPRGVGDCHGHGTHVAGTVGGATYGVAKAVTIVPVRVLDCSNFGWYSWFIAGIDWIAGHHGGRPAVMNGSLGGPAYGPLDRAVRRLVASGVPAVVSAGNDSTEACSASPARAPEAITVGATDLSNSGRRDRIVNPLRYGWGSNYGPCVDIFAPGVGVRSSLNTSDTATARWGGTSMAAPHVTGVVAVLLSQRPSLTPAEIDTFLTTNSTQGRITLDVGWGSPNRLLFAKRSRTFADPPGRPREVSAVPGVGHVVMSWKAPEKIGEPLPVTGYRVRCVPGSPGLPTLRGSTVVRSLQVSGTTSGATYDCRVRAVNRVGPGKWSPVATVTAA